MSEVLLPLGDEELRTPIPGHARRTSLMTSVGLVEGDVLAYLEEHGATTSRQLIRSLEWPASLVMMGLGALVRAGVVQAVQRDLEVIVMPGTRASHVPTGAQEGATPPWRGGAPR